MMNKMMSRRSIVSALMKSNKQVISSQIRMISMINKNFMVKPVMPVVSSLYFNN